MPSMSASQTSRVIKSIVVTYQSKTPASDLSETSVLYVSGQSNLVLGVVWRTHLESEKESEEISSSCHNGSMMLNVVPIFSSLVNQMRPFMASTLSRIRNNDIHHNIA